MFGFLESVLEVAQVINPQLGSPNAGECGSYSLGGALSEPEPEEDNTPSEQTQIEAAFIIGRLTAERLFK